MRLHLLQIQHSSGNLVADRRATYAAALAGEHAYADAAELMEQALELAPDWPAGWSLLGEYRQKSGNAEGAIAAWNELLVHDSSGVFGARLKLAALGAVPDLSPARAYVAALFDDYAPRFDHSLVEKLAYRVPERIAEMVGDVVAQRGSAPLGRALDLGCGTGLVGEQVRAMTDRLEGVDLSARMLAVARRKGIYDALAQDDLVGFLAADTTGADLIIAADVLNYVGELDVPLSAARTVLRAGGLLAFSLETHEGGEAVRLSESLRFQHSGTQALQLCSSLGLEVLRAEEVRIRTERGHPVAGLIVVAAAS